MRVVSWNIHWGCGKDGRIRIHAIIDVLRRLNADVICLQEVAANHPELEGSASANQFKQLSGALGAFQAIEHATSEIYRHNTPRLFGNLMLSKYRITQVQRHMLPWPADPGSPAGMPRGAMEAVLDAPRGRVRLVTTHLEYYSRMQRLAQVQQLRKLHAEACARASLPGLDVQLDAPFQLGPHGGELGCMRKHFGRQLGSGANTDKMHICNFCFEFVVRQSALNAFNLRVARCCKYIHSRRVNALQQ